MNGPIQLGAFNYDPAAQQQRLQQQAQQRAMAEQAMRQRAQLLAQQQQARSAQQAAPMQGGMAQAAGAQPAGGGQPPPSLMQQLGQFGSPANSALLNFGLETLNSANQGGSTVGSLAAGLGGGAGAYIQGKQLESQNASLAERDEFDRRLRELQMAEMMQRLNLSRGAGMPQMGARPAGAY